MLASQAAYRGIGQVNWICDPSTGPAPGRLTGPTASIADLMQADAKWGTWPEAANIRHTPGTAAAAATAAWASRCRPGTAKGRPAYHSDVDGVVVTNYRASFLSTTGVVSAVPRRDARRCHDRRRVQHVRTWRCLPAAIAASLAAQQIPADMPTLRVTTALSGGTVATIVITYTNQDGTGGRTATLVLGTNPAWAPATITPHLQGTDTGILSVQNISVTGVNAERSRSPAHKAIATDMHHTSSGAANVQLAMPKRHLILQTGDLLNVASSAPTPAPQGSRPGTHSAVNK